MLKKSLASGARCSSPRQCSALSTEWSGTIRHSPHGAAVGRARARVPRLRAARAGDYGSGWRSSEDGNHVHHRVSRAVSGALREALTRAVIPRLPDRRQRRASRNTARSVSTARRRWPRAGGVPLPPTESPAPAVCGSDRGADRSAGGSSAARRPGRTSARRQRSGRGREARTGCDRGRRGTRSHGEMITPAGRTGPGVLGRRAVPSTGAASLELPFCDRARDRAAVGNWTALLKSRLRSIVSGRDLQ